MASPPSSANTFIYNNVYMTNLLFTLLLPLATLMAADRTNPISTMEKKNYYCEYCGHKFPDVRTLTSGTCPKHPDGSNRGHHKLYEGTEKSKYTCKYCGKQFPSIMVMVGGQCVNHPKGSNKGPHAPAL
jgi:DNA-directed RNA polymerase subunit RPC12/RpoP